MSEVRHQYSQPIVPATAPSGLLRRQSAVRRILADKKIARRGLTQLRRKDTMGSPLDPDVFRSDVLYPVLRQLGILIVPRASGFHMFRHTAASLINKETGNMKLSQAQLGHANVQITADVYTHVDEGQRRKAAEALERGILGEL